MSGITRTTRESSWSGLNPVLQRAFRSYFESHGLGDPAAEKYICCETRTERSGSGKIASWIGGSPDAVDHLGMILTEHSLLWSRVGDRSGTVVAGADLKEIRVRAYTSRLSKESGLELSGLVGDRKERVSGKLALGPEPSAKKFVDEVIRAVEQANPPPKEREIPWFKWGR